MLLSFTRKPSLPLLLLQDALLTAPPSADNSMCIYLHETVLLFKKDTLVVFYIMN